MAHNNNKYKAIPQTMVAKLLPVHVEEDRKGGRERGTHVH